MNLDDFKSQAKGITAPASAPSGDANLGGFIAELRARDQRARRLILRMSLTLFSVGLVFAIVGRTHGPGMVLVGVGIMFVAGYMRLIGRWLAHVDYSLPAREFLAQAANRYRFWRARDTLCTIPLLAILSLGGALTIRSAAMRYLSPRATLLILVGYGVFLAALCVFAWIVSRRNWHKENAALLDEIHRRQQELGNG